MDGLKNERKHDRSRRRIYLDVIYIVKYLLVAMLLAMLVAILAGCDQEAQPKPNMHELNRERAFRAAKPGDVIIINSSYWKSAHITREFKYFFKLQKNDRMIKRLFAGDAMLKLNARDSEKALEKAARSRPKWFAPGDAGQYEVYIYAKEPRQNFRVILHKQTRLISLSDYII